MREFVGLEHQFPVHENIMVVDWGVSNVCNFNCSYCPPRTHRGDFPFVPVQDILGFANRVLDHYKKKLKKDVYFIFTGGEVTLFKDFIFLVKTLTEGGERVGISSNGAHNLKFWKEAKKYLEHVSLSYHSENTDLDHFISVINEIKGSTTTHVNVMMLPDKFEQCEKAIYRILEETDDIRIDVQMVLKNFIEPYPYTEQQRSRMLEISKDISTKFKLKRERKTYRGLMKVLYSDGTSELMNPGDILTRKMHNWKGWECNVGLELMVIDINGDIFRSWCGDAPKIGNIKDPVLKFKETPRKCSKEWCTGGITDAMITRYKKN